MSVPPSLRVRWTIGDVSHEGFEALRLSIAGACRVFGPETEYVVYVNTRDMADARARTGETPSWVAWRQASRDDMPAFLSAHFDAGLAEGVGWKLIPLRSFDGRHELALDNDCILWECPAAVERWLTEPDATLVAEDVRACFGRFATACGHAPRNSGIRGVPPTFDLEAALREVLRRTPVLLESETDEQGLQVAALGIAQPPLVVSLDAVTICSPFYTHQQHLGRCGAHFVGLNARHLPWNYYGRPAVDCLREHWARVRPAVEARLGIG